MSTITLPNPVPGSSYKLLTAADVAALPRRLPSGDVGYELHRGRLLVMAPPGDSHARRQARFTAYLFNYGELRGYGQVRVEVGLLLSRNPDHLVCPDVAFLTATQLPPQLSPEGYLITVPGLIVEVRSKNDTQSELDEKVRDYLVAGANLVWIADPEAHTITAYTSRQPTVTFTATDIVTADSVIPGFAIPVAELLAP